MTLVGGFASTLSFPACELFISSLGWRPALAVIGGVVLVVVVPLQAWALRGQDKGVRPGAAVDSLTAASVGVTLSLM